MAHSEHTIAVIRRMKAEGALCFAARHPRKKAGLAGSVALVYDSGPPVARLEGALRIVAISLKCPIMQRLKALSGHSFAVSGKTMSCKGS